MLEWLAPHLSHDEAHLVQECLSVFDQGDVQPGTLISYSQRLETLERRYAGENPAQQPPADLQGRVLVCSVGMRPQPVILTILLLKPRRVYLLHSEDSRPKAELIRNDKYVGRLNLPAPHGIMLREISLTNAPENYDRLQQILQENPGQQVVVDISGGVKVMGVSLAAAAFWLRIPVIYQLGTEVKGIIKPFSATLTLLENPFAYFGSPELQAIQDLFEIGDYDAALSVCHRLKDTVGDVQTLERLAILEELILVYRDWDLFLHSLLEDDPQRKLAQRLDTVRQKMARLELQFIQDADLDANLRFLETVERAWRAGQRNHSELYRLVDIYASSQRRGHAGKYDDAVGRLYRCLEMAATICLVRDFDVRDVSRKPNLKMLDTHCPVGEGEGLDSKSR